MARRTDVPRQPVARRKDAPRDGNGNHAPDGLTCPVAVANLPAQTDVLPPA
jgi:hypothetical protein